MQWLVAFGFSIIIYMILQSIDDHRCRQKQMPCASVHRKLVLFFFILIVVFVATFFMSSSENENVVNIRNRVIGGAKEIAIGGGSGGGQGGFETAKVNELNMLKNIREDIYVGSGPFTKSAFYS